MMAASLVRRKSKAKRKVGGSGSTFFVVPTGSNPRKVRKQKQAEAARL